MSFRRIGVGFSLLLGLVALDWAWSKEVPGPVTAEVDLLCDRGYYPRVLELLKQARKDIHAVIYYVGDPRQERPRAMLDALVEAKERGLEVSVQLDGPAEGEEDRNKPACDYLKEHGIQATYDGPEVTTHTKALVVDGEILVLGSANWTQGALAHNHEAGVVVRSPVLAKRLLEEFERIRKKEKGR